MGIDTGLGAQHTQTCTDVGKHNITPAKPAPHEALEREAGIEPASLAWKAKVLPLNYSRLTTHRRAARGDAALPCSEPQKKFAVVEEGGFEPP